MTTKKVALVVVDVQRDFCEGGTLAVAGGQSVANRLLDIVQARVGSVYYTKDWHIDPGSHFSDNPDYIDSWPKHCVAETHGAEFAAPFQVPSGQIFFKGQWEAAYSGANARNVDKLPLTMVLASKGYEVVEVAGIALDYCVKQTALDLAADGFKVKVLLDLTASVHPENNREVITEFLNAGIAISFNASTS